jgi:muconolactone delta-isomerase
MVYLVISTPHPAKPEDIKDVRARWWTWAEDLKSRKKAVCFYVRAGRGAIVIFDVSSNEELHELMTQWSNIVPVRFDVYPLVDSPRAQELLK